MFLILKQDVHFSQNCSPQQFAAANGLILPQKTNGWLCQLVQCSMPQTAGFFRKMKKVKVVYTTLRVEVPLNKNPSLPEYWLKGSPIFSEFLENSAKFMKNSGLTKWTQSLC